MTLPAVGAVVVAEAVAALPGRLRKRLDAVVEDARQWPVERAGAEVVVRADEQTTVTFAGGEVRCSCLLAPRCLHRAAVLSLAPVASADGSSTPASSSTPVGSSTPASSSTPVGSSTPASSSTRASSSAASGEVVAGTDADERTPVPPAVSAGQLRAAAELATAAAGVLNSGIPGAGAVAQADLLRAVHQARANGLHLPAAAAVRVVENLRAARRDDPAFRLSDLHQDLLELLSSCHRLAAGDGTAIGVARRDYEPVGDLRLYGLFCEPIRAATGHAGAATCLADAGGRLWMISDVKPADPAVAVSATRASVELGEVRLSHHDLSRRGILAINAHASSTGRLSHGRARQAVSADGVSWFDDPLDALWQTGVSAQVDRWLAAEQPAHDLAFLDGVVRGADRRGLLLHVEPAGITIAVTAVHEDPALPYVSNLRSLAAHAGGRPVRLIGRFTGPRRVAGLAIAARWLPAHHGGHVDLGAIRLTRADLGEPPTTDLGETATVDPGEPPTVDPGEPPTVDPGEPAATDLGETTATERAAPGPQAPPLHLLRHHLERVVAAGRPVLLTGVDDDVRRLTAAQLNTAAAVLGGLGIAGVRRTRDVFGRLDPHDAELLARAWLTAAIYEQAAGREVTRAAWTAPDRT